MTEHDEEDMFLHNAKIFIGVITVFALCALAVTCIAT